jgi:hypothetical protein
LGLLARRAIASKRELSTESSSGHNKRTSEAWTRRQLQLIGGSQAVTNPS